MKNIASKVLISLILVLHLIIRVVGLDKSPASVNWDEASLGYNAYSLLVTGADEFGKRWPLALRSFDDYKPALYSYLSMIPIKIWGLNQRSTRVVSAVAGTMSLIGLAGLINIYIHHQMASWLLCFLVGFGPVRLHFSRVALETNLSMAFFTFGLFFWLKRQKIWSLVFWILAFLSYHSARIAVPFLMILALIDPIKMIRVKNYNIKISKQDRWLLIILAGCVGGLLYGGISRFKAENLFSRYWPFTPRNLLGTDLVSQIRVSPLYYLSGIILGHLFSYVSLANYGANIYHWIKYSVQFVPNLTFLGFWETLCLIPGLLILSQKLNLYNYRFLLYAILATAIPTVVTWNWFHTLRAVNMLPILEIVAVIGLINILKKLKISYLVLVFLIIVGLGQIAYLTINEIVYSPVENYEEYQPGGFKEGVPLVKSLGGNYRQIIVDSKQANPYIFFLFYGQEDPRNLIEFKKKYIFRPIDWFRDKELSKVILWQSAEIKIEEVEAVEGAKIYYVAGPTNDYYRAAIITLP